MRLSGVGRALPRVCVSSCRRGGRREREKEEEEEAEDEEREEAEEEAHEEALIGNERGRVHARASLPFL